LNDYNNHEYEILASAMSIITITGLGSYNRTMHALILADGNVYISQCGCFSGTLSEFEKQVKNSKGLKYILRSDYLLMADLLKSRASNVINYLEQMKKIYGRKKS
jgi:hypothetical protein